jgi:hypothetical protein
VRSTKTTNHQLCEPDVFFCVMAPYFAFLCQTVIFAMLNTINGKCRRSRVCDTANDVIPMTSESGLYGSYRTCTLSGVSFYDAPELDRPHRISFVLVISPVWCRCGMRGYSIRDGSRKMTCSVFAKCGQGSERWLKGVVG